MPTDHRIRITAPAITLLILATVIAGLIAFTAIDGISHSRALAAMAALIASAALAYRLAKHRRPPLPEAPSRGVLALSTIATIVVLVQLVRLTVFIVDANQTSWSVAPWNAWLTQHSCVSAYWAAANEARSISDLYGDDLTTGSTAGTARPAPRKLGALYVDPYEYPPTFLLLPRALLFAAPDFFSFRALWFALNLAIVAGSLIVVARRTTPIAGTTALWLAPIVLAPLAITSTLQIGNVQLACVALSMLGMLWIDDEQSQRFRLPLGALALAFAVVSKLYPGMLLIYLAAQRRWRALAWTCAWCLILVLIGLWDLGATPHLAFLDHLPKLLSGEAFRALTNPRGVSGNMSVPGIVFKLGVVYGVPHMSFDAARVVGWIYTLIAVAITIQLARLKMPKEWQPLAWLSILTLATLRSPLLPPYGTFAPLWLAVIILAVSWSHPRKRVVALFMVAILSPVTPSQTLLPPSLHAIVTFAQTLTALALVIVTMRSSGSHSIQNSPAILK
jgi:alpha-1,2-mannosyltransferase